MSAKESVPFAMSFSWDRYYNVGCPFLDYRGLMGDERCAYHCKNPVVVGLVKPNDILEGCCYDGNVEDGSCANITVSNKVSAGIGASTREKNKWRDVCAAYEALTSKVSMAEIAANYGFTSSVYVTNAVRRVFKKLKVDPVDMRRADYWGDDDIIEKVERLKVYEESKRKSE
jgi:hypothetical protein